MTVVMIGYDRDNDHEVLASFDTMKMAETYVVQSKLRHKYGWRPYFSKESLLAEFDEAFLKEITVHNPVLQQLDVKKVKS